MNRLIAVPAHEVTSLAHGVTDADDAEPIDYAGPINGLNASYGVYCWVSGQPVSTWREALFGPGQMVASSTNRHSAAMAAVMHLAAMNEVDLALVVRDRDTGRNEALIRWVELWGSSVYPYRFSEETWA